jgi:hypothetical protein
MSRDYWMTRRKTPIIDKLKQTITLKAGTWACGREQGAQYVTTGQNLYGTSISSSLSSRKCTIEFWWKFETLPSYYTERDILFLGSASYGDSVKYAVKVRYNATTNQFVIYLGDNLNPITSASFNTGVSTITGQWHHYAVTRNYSGGTTTVKFYVDGVLVYTGTTAAFDSTSLAGAGLYVGDQTAAGIYIQGWLTDLRLWSTVRSDADIAQNYKKQLSIDGLPTFNKTLLDSFLMSYVANPTNIPNFGLENETPYVSYYSSPIVLVRESIITSYGGSFVTAEWSVTLPNKVSLQWPATPPANTTGALYVRWIDSDGVTQRRILWTLSGVDVAPPSPTYVGENLGSSFTLEFWNVDGANTTVLPQDYVLGISSCTNPTTSYDKTQQSAVTVTADSTLAKTYPLTPFPLVFNTQQTY